VDADVVDVSNIHRQVIHYTSDAQKGEFKANSAAFKLKLLNPYVQIDTYCESFDFENALELVSKYDVVRVNDNRFPDTDMVSVHP